MQRNEKEVGIWKEVYVGAWETKYLEEHAQKERAGKTPTKTWQSAGKENLTLVFCPLKQLLFSTYDQVILFSLT